MAALVDRGLSRIDMRFAYKSFFSQYGKTLRINNAKPIAAQSHFYSMFTSSRPEENKESKNEDKREFRSLNLRGNKQDEMRRGKKQPFRQQPMLPPRYTRMPVDQDWPSVWPTAQSFKASVVPLPIRQGFNDKGAPPEKYGNAELMKIPNFLHLTPPAIRRHCEAIKHFCTPWPKELTDDKVCEQHFPVSVTTTDYLQSGPSIREPKARIVSVKLGLSRLEMNAHAKDKFLRLVGERYNTKTGDVTIVTDRCPLKKQNYDYAMYLLTALYYESWKTEPWESEKDEEDAEQYDWNKSQSKTETLTLLKTMKSVFSQGKNKDASPKFLGDLPENCAEDDILKLKEVVSYAKSVTVIHNEGEDHQTLNEYKESVLKLLNVKNFRAELST